MFLDSFRITVNDNDLWQVTIQIIQILKQVNQQNSAIILTSTRMKKSKYYSSKLLKQNHHTVTIHLNMSTIHVPSGISKQSKGHMTIGVKAIYDRKCCL